VTEDEEEGVGSYWVSLRKGEDTVADHFNIVGLRIAGVSYGRSMACM